MSKYWNLTQIETIVLTSKNMIFNGSLFSNSETVIRFVASKQVQEWSWISILSPNWHCKQNEANFNWQFFYSSSWKMWFFTNDNKPRHIIYHCEACAVTNHFVLVSAPCDDQRRIAVCSRRFHGQFLLRDFLTITTIQGLGHAQRKLGKTIVLPTHWRRSKSCQIARIKPMGLQTQHALFLAGSNC